MQQQHDLNAVLADLETVVTVASADDLFGVFTRQVEVPRGYVGLVTTREGRGACVREGQMASGDDARDVLFARTQPIELNMRVDRLHSRDRHACSARLTIRVEVVPEPVELENLRRALLGSRSLARTSDLVRWLHGAVDDGMRSLAAEQDASTLIDGDGSVHLVEGLTDALRGPCFESGLSIVQLVRVELESPSYAQVRHAQVQATRQLQEHDAGQELREAIAQAHEQRLDNLESMLSRVENLAASTPDRDLPELMRAFAESERSAMYAALFEARSRTVVTRWIAVASGAEMLLFDAHAGSETPARRLALEHEIGPLRSVQCVEAPNGRHVLLVGAAQGVHVVDPDHLALRATCSFDGEALRGGVNAAVWAGNYLLASHSERGVVAWMLPDADTLLAAGDGSSAVLMNEDARFVAAAWTASARAVRAVQYAAGRFWFTIDDLVASVCADTLGDPRAYQPGGGLITSLLAEPGRLWIGTSDGSLLTADLGAVISSGPTGVDVLGRAVVGSIDIDTARAGQDGASAAAMPAGAGDLEIAGSVMDAARRLSSERVHSRPGRAIESIHLVSSGGVQRLVFTDTSLVVHARVVGDAFDCGYEAGGQTIKRVEAAADVLVGLSEARDRIFVWSAGQPRKPARIVPVMRLTRRSVQDVALIPLEGRSA